MPELPEVEVICQGLRPHILGKTIEDVFCSGKQLRVPVDCEEIRNELCNKKISSLTRRAKYLLLTMQNGATLILHLGMTGNIGIFEHETTRRKHDHICWLLNDKKEMRLNDTRRFGAVHLLPANDAERLKKEFFVTTGPEPFSRTCTAGYLHKCAAKRNQAVKSFIMDSRVIAGIGNIYANESLFRTAIHPARPASSLSEKEWRHLLTIIRKTLKHAIQCGGSTISDFVNASGDGGYFQMNFQIYGKNGSDCLTCKNTIQKTVIGGRASFYCPVCQKTSA